MKPATILTLVLLLGALAAVPAHAQTVVNPTTVEFDPSADHSALTTDGQAMVQRYDLQIYTLTGTTPYTTANLGKPSPQSDGKIRVAFATLVASWPLPDGSYDARVVAVGPTGTAQSDLSNTFAFQSCTITLGSPTQAFPSGGATGSVSVTAGSTCAWTASTTAGWVTVNAPTSGTGSGNVGFTVAANLTGVARAAALTIGGQTFTITQAAATVSCTYSISPASQAFTQAGGTGSFTLTSNGACAWTATSSATWVTLQASSGTGSSPVGFTVAPNASTIARTATITAAGQVFNVSQAAAPCTYSLSATSQAVAAGGGTGSVTITAGSGCGWTATSNTSWVTVTTASGTGTNSASFSVGANTDVNPRTGTLTIAGQTFTVNQAAAACTYALSPTTQSVAAAGGQASASLAAPAACTWTASTNAAWVTLGATNGTGGAAIPFSVAPNATAAARSASIIVAGQTLTVSQAGGSCTYALSASASPVFGQGGGTGSVSVNCGSGCSWTASSDATWLTVTSAAGTGSGTVSYTVAKNSTTSTRTARITVKDQVYTVTQNARPSSPKKVRVTSVVGG